MGCQSWQENYLSTLIGHTDTRQRRYSPCNLILATGPFPASEYSPEVGLTVRIRTLCPDTCPHSYQIPEGKGVRKAKGQTPISHKTSSLSGRDPWYVGFKLRRTTPDCLVRKWDDPHPFSRRQLPCLLLDPAKASLLDAVSTPSPSPAASCILSGETGLHPDQISAAEQEVGASIRDPGFCCRVISSDRRAAPGTGCCRSRYRG